MDIHRKTFLVSFQRRGRHGRMVLGFTINCAISAYHH